MKNVHVTTREFGLKIFVWLMLPMAAAISAWFLSPRGSFFAPIAGPLTFAFIGLYYSIKPAGYNQRWGWKRILIFALLVSLIALGVWWCLNAAFTSSASDPVRMYMQTLQP